MGEMVSVAPKDFKTRLEAFLNPAEGTKAMSGFAKEQEKRYTEAYNLHEIDQRTDRYNELIDIFKFQEKESDKNESREMSPEERIWKTDFMARCHLLHATFHHDGRLCAELGQFKLDVPYTQKVAKNRSESQNKMLEEAESLCGEMRHRIWKEREMKIFGKGAGWTPRMTDSWLEQTRL